MEGGREGREKGGADSMAPSTEILNIPLLTRIIKVKL
jgi:hypothetical protein